MAFSVSNQTIDVHKRQQPGIQLKGLGFATFSRITDANLEGII